MPHSPLKAKSPASKAPAKKPSVKSSAASPQSLQVGQKIPSFSLPCTILGTVHSASLKGQPFVLYFYPKDDTSGCTAEACDFLGALPKFKKLNVPVIGVSKDSLARHEKFSEKYNLSFPLASDAETHICEAFGVWVQKSMYGRTYMGIERSTFLVDAKGIIRTLWRKVSVPGHVDEVYRALQAL